MGAERAQALQLCAPFRWASFIPYKKYPTVYGRKYPTDMMPDTQPKKA